MEKGHIPVVDFEDFFSESRKDFFVESVGNALEEIGFFAVKNHPISINLLEDMYSTATKFFDLPEENKKAYERPDLLGQRGYTGFGKEHAKGSNAPDLKEFYMVAKEMKDNVMISPFGPNVWPSEIPDFSAVSLKLFEKLELLGNSLLECCALHIGQKKDFFTEMTKNSDTMLRVIHYPPIGDEIPNGSIRSGAHEDINLITLLCSSTARGLELLQRNGEWLSIETGSEYVIVDSGDMIQNITNGIFKSTTHRVVNPPDSNSRRFSIPFFVHPRKDIDLTPLDSCISKSGGISKYPSITAGEYLEKRLKAIGLG